MGGSVNLQEIIGSITYHDNGFVFMGEPYFLEKYVVPPLGLSDTVEGSFLKDICAKDLASYRNSLKAHLQTCVNRDYSLNLNNVLQIQETLGVLKKYLGHPKILEVLNVKTKQKGTFKPFEATKIEGVGFGVNFDEFII